MTDLFEEHLKETKKELNEIAERVMLKKDEAANHIFGLLLRKVENVGLSTYLMDHANKRIEAFYLICTDEEWRKKYEEELIVLIQNHILK